MNEPKFKVGDLVYYRPTYCNAYADGSKHLGVIVEVKREGLPLFLNFPENEIFEFEYIIKWINTGYTSSLMGFNLEKLEAPKDT